MSHDRLMRATHKQQPLVLSHCTQPALWQQCAPMCACAQNWSGGKRVARATKTAQSNLFFRCFSSLGCCFYWCYWCFYGGIFYLTRTQTDIELPILAPESMFCCVCVRSKCIWISNKNFSLFFFASIFFSLSFTWANSFVLLLVDDDDDDKNKQHEHEVFVLRKRWKKWA